MMPSPRILIRTALAVVLLALISNTLADPDLWGHVWFGGHTLSAWSIPRIHSYSFTADREWINHSWLADCVMYIAYAIGGGPGLVVLKMTVVLLMLAIVWNALKREQVDAASRDLLIAFAVIGTFQQAHHVRPQVFSVAAFAFMLAVLIKEGPASRLLLIPPVFALWVNLHGGWIVGGGVLAIWSLLTLPTSVSTREKGVLFLVGALALVGTLANPYGWGMWEFLRTTVGFGRAEITDWQPLYRLGAAYVAVWVLLVLPAAVGILHSWRSQQREWRRLVVVVLLAVVSLQVSRLLAFFAIAVVMLLGRDIARSLSAWRTASTATGRQQRRPAVALAVVVAVALIIGGTVASASNVSCVRMGNELPEPEIVALVKQRQLQGRLAVWFDWGEYATWYFAPALRVSIDGWRETVYSEDLMQKHLNFYYVPASREAFLTEMRPDHIWLLADLPVVSRLLADGWQPLYRGPRSVWLSRNAASTLDRKAEASGPPATSSEIGRRCFPGP
jgi:hypothetical protein